MRMKNWKNKMKKGMAVMMLACLLFAWGNANEEAGIAPCGGVDFTITELE